MRLSPRMVIVGIILAVVGVFVVVASQQQAGTKAVVDGVVTQVMSSAQADSQVTFPIVFSESDPEHESAHVFEALQGVPGVATAAVMTASAELRVDFDSKQVDEATLRTALVKAGYVQLTAADATSAVLSEDGKVQTLSIADDHGLVPGFIKVKAGVPSELSFAKGTECRTSLKFPELGIEVPLAEPATVKIPALEAGTYQIVCSQDGPEGAIIAE